MHTQAWTEAETRFAANLARTGASPAAIAMAMPHRSPDAIKNRLSRMSGYRWTVRHDAFELDLRGRLRGRGTLTA